MKILFVDASGFPVPAVQGSAFATHTENIIRVYQELRSKKEVKANDRIGNAVECDSITVVSGYDEKAIQEAKDFNFAKFLYFIPKEQKKSRLTILIYSMELKLFGHELCHTVNIKRAYNEVKDKDFDVVVIMGCDPLQFYPFTKRYGRNAMYVQLGGIIDGNCYLKKMYRKVICVSGYVKNRLIENGVMNEDDAHTILSAINTEEFASRISEDEKTELREKWGIKDGEFVVGFWGRVAPVKGVIELIDAFEMSNIRGSKLLIIGSANFGLINQTDYEAQVEQRVRGNDKIILTGFQHRSALAKLLQIVDVAVLPSMWEEPSGNVVPEALASGLPLIITDSGGMVEYVDEQCALIIKRDDNLISNMSEAISGLYRDEDRRKRMSNAAYERANKYDIKGYYKEMINLFRSDKNE